MICKLADVYYRLDGYWSRPCRVLRTQIDIKRHIGNDWIGLVLIKLNKNNNTFVYDGGGGIETKGFQFPVLYTRNPHQRKSIIMTILDFLIFQTMWLWRADGQSREKLNLLRINESHHHTMCWIVWCDGNGHSSAKIRFFFFFPVSIFMHIICSYTNQSA
jgi:hypothetical protein